LVYGAALNAWQHGYGHLYDFAGQKAAVEGLGAYWSPFINPPPLAWLGTLFLPLPFDVAVVLWTALVFAAALLAWYLVAPGAGLTRAAHLALYVGLFPTAFGLMVGQPVALVAAAVAGAWWLAERDRPLAAGIVLSLVAIKPQLALLVPLCLLVAGRRRMFVAWLAAPAVIVAGWLVLRSGASPVQVVLMVAGYALLELALVVLAVPILVAEAALLVSLLATPAPNQRVPAVAAFARPGSLRAPANAGNPE